MAPLYLIIYKLIYCTQAEFQSISSLWKAIKIVPVHSLASQQVEKNIFVICPILKTQIEKKEIFVTKLIL